MAGILFFHVTYLLYNFQRKYPVLEIKQSSRPDNH